MAGQVNKKNATPEGVDIDAIVARAVAKAQAERAKILEEAHKEARKAKGEKFIPLSDEEKAMIAEGEELVDVRLPIIKNGTDVFVAVNGENVVVPRGKTVKIKRKFLNVLKDAERQNDEAMLLIRGLTTN